MREYPKIYSPYKRYTDGPNKNKLIKGEWFMPEFELLAEIPWVWTEKIDGTNIRVNWDGHKVTFGGRTDRAQIPPKLSAKLQELFKEELFEQVFKDSEVTLFGEGYGSNIQKGGGNYSTEPDFILFDVLIGEWWLLRADVVGIAKNLGIEVVPDIEVGDTHNFFMSGVQAAISTVSGGLRSRWDAHPNHPPTWYAEGLVGVPEGGFLTRGGQRIMMKVKTCDFFGIDYVL